MITGGITMKAVVFDGLQKVECRTVKDPVIEKDDDIIVKLLPPLSADRIYI